MPYLITLTGPSGSGKSTVVKYFLRKRNKYFHAKLIPKYTTRNPRKDDSGEVICVKEIPAECDIIYEQYKVRYGICLDEIFILLAKGISPIIILNDVRTVEDVQDALKGLVKSFFVFRQSPTLENHRLLAKSRGVNNESEIEQRFRKAQAIYRIYIENIYLFDHVIINAGSRTDLRMQVLPIIKSLKQENNWPLKEVKRVKCL